MELSDEIFGIEPNEGVMSLVVKTSSLTAVRAHRRQRQDLRLQAAASAYRQKVQAMPAMVPHAAHSTSAGNHLWTKPRSYSYTVPKKVRRLALKSALSSKVANSQLIVVEDMNLAEIKTAAVANALKSIGAGSSALVVLEGANQNAELSARKHQRRQDSICQHNQCL